MKEYYVEFDLPEVKWSKYSVEILHFDWEPNKYVAPAHMHEAIEFLYVKKGDHIIFMDDYEYVAHAGDIVLFRSNMIHGWYTGSDREHSNCVVKVKPSIIFDLASDDTAAGYAMRFLISHQGMKAHWTAEELAGSEMQEALERLLAAHKGEETCRDMALTLWVGMLVRDALCDIIYDEQESSMKQNYQDQLTSQIYKIIMWINHNYASPLTAQDCAREANMSYSYFSRSFKRITQQSFKEYLNKVRINHAENLLITTDISITQVALECGYNNVSYFISVYKAMKRKTPFDYRRQHT